MAITTGILVGVGTAVSGTASVVNAVQTGKFQDAQREQMKKSEERQTKLDNELKAQNDQAELDATAAAKRAQDKARQKSVGAGGTPAVGMAKQGQATFGSGGDTGGTLLGSTTIVPPSGRVPAGKRTLLGM